MAERWGLRKLTVKEAGGELLTLVAVLLEPLDVLDGQSGELSVAGLLRGGRGHFPSLRALARGGWDGSKRSERSALTKG